MEEAEEGVGEDPPRLEINKQVLSYITRNRAAARSHGFGGEGQRRRQPAPDGAT